MIKVKTHPNKVSITYWILYNATVGLSVYWASNLILWFPWSYSTTLGMILMLTINPVLWGFATYLCLRTFPNKNLLKAAFLNSLVFLVMAILLDYLFFGLIRGAIKELYHPTTFYGYAFIACVPFILLLIFRKKIGRNKKYIEKTDFIKVGFTGLMCFFALTLIIGFGIEI